MRRMKTLHKSSPGAKQHDTQRKVTVMSRKQKVREGIREREKDTALQSELEIDLSASPEGFDC